MKNKRNIKNNSSKNFNKSIIRRNIITLSTSFALMVVALIATILVLNTHVREKKFMAYDGYYNSGQTTIDSTNYPAQQYVKFSDIYTISNMNVTATGSPATNQYITIESKADLYAFSKLCNSSATFAGYKYKLLRNIDWDEDGTVYYFDPITRAFTGEFDGNGYTIKNLTMTVDDNGTRSNDYAMFLTNNGTIKNLGLIDIFMTVNASPVSGSTLYIATLCAKNTGTIDYVFVRDNLDAEEKANHGGMSITAPNYRVSGVVAVNSGTFTNSYYAGTKVYNPSGAGSQDTFQEILLENSGTISNLHFYDSLIADVTGTMDAVTNSNVAIEYSELNKKIDYNTHYGIWCQTLDDLFDNVTGVSGTNWITSSYYSNENNTNISNFGSLINFVTPLLKKLDETNVQYDTSTSKYIIKINSTEDFNYIFNSMKLNAKFTDSSMVYKLNCDINMNDIAIPSYDDSIQSTFTSFDTSTPRKIYFDKYNYYVSTGNYNAYGVFPFFSGELSYINFIVGTSSNQKTISTTTAGVKAIGTAVGYAETAVIDNVNVYVNVTLNNSIGKYFIGGIAGVIGDKTVISNSTVNGSITTTNSNPGSFNDDANNVNGIAIGGAVGFVAKSGGSLDTVLSTVNITSAGYTNKEVNIGGVVGAGYLIDTFQLQNNGTINVGTSESAAAYSQIHLAGVIGRFLGMYNQANMFTNNGDITLYQQTNAATYYAGILNADIQVSNKGEYYLTYKGKAQFWAAALSNGANILIYNTNTNANFMYTYGVNIKNSNGFATKLSGVYNLNYRFASESTALGAMTINMNQIKKFAPVIMSNNTSSSTDNISLTTVYNLRDITYDTSAALTASVYYTGCVMADYVNYIDVRNEGNQTMTIDNALTGNVNITGVFYELTGGFTAKSIYNGGNITVTYTAIVTGNINASGICYANNNGFSASEIQKYNPSNDNFDKDAVGSINNCINNGAIEVTNPNYANITFNKVEIKSSNGDVITENHWNPASAPAAYLVGNINVTGIAVYNYSVITNTFNIGDMFAANYVCNNSTDNKNEINASGLVTYNIGGYAIIENCANDGDIKAINMSFYMVFDNGQSNVNVQTAKNAYVNSSGIVAHNDENADGSTYNNSNSHSKQIIAFTINYGSIYSYNVRRNSTTSADPNFRAISGGILGQGLLNTVNVMNYGNVYGSEVAGGIIGVMFFECFKTEVNSSNSVVFANTINYTPVKIIDKGELVYRDNTLYTYRTYSTFKSLNASSTCYFTELPVYSKDYYNGSIFGIINFNGDSNAQYMKIRYLISFNDDITLVGAEAATPTLPDGAIDLSTFFSAYIKYESGFILDQYIGKNVTYAPLSSDKVTINHVEYTGVFNNDFKFKQAIDGNAEALDVDHHRTDIFISDYFYFVGVLYVNELLLNKIGWGNIAYSAAAETFATKLESVGVFVKYLAGKDNTSAYDSLVAAAFNTDTWLSKCDTEILTEVVNTLIENEDTETLLAMINYIFSSSSSSYSIIKTETRTAILEAILQHDETINYSDLLDVIITYVGNYSELLANSALDKSDEAGEYLHNYIKSLSNSKVEDILTTYCNYLKNTSTNGYFTYSTSEQARYDILSAMFENINDNSFYDSLAEIIEIDDQLSGYTLSPTLSMYEGYSSLTSEQRIVLYQAIARNNTILTNLSNMNNYIGAMATEIDFYVQLIKSGYSKTSMASIYNDIKSTTVEESSTTVIDERVALWNQIRNTNVFKDYLTNLLGNEYVAKATEFRNTYQTTTYPYPLAYSVNGDLSFTYTFNITPSTYFLGPYKDKNKTQFDYVAVTTNVAPTNGDSNTTKRSVVDVMTKAEADYLYDNGFTYAYQLFYYEYSDSSSNNQLCAVRRTVNGVEENKYAFTWFKTSKNTDFTGGFLSGRYDDDGVWYDEPVIATINGVDIDVSGGGISKFTSTTNGSTGEGNWANNLNKTGSWILTDINGKQYTQTGTLTDWADFIIEHEIRHYISYPTDQWHSTRCSGLGKYRSGNRWFTWKSETYPVYSSQYIDYSIDDLLRLDGYLTSYDDGTTVDETERSIINELFNTHFVGDANFNAIITAALFEQNAYIRNDSYYRVTSPTLNKNFTSYYTLTATQANLYDSSKKYYKLVDNNYIEVDSKNVTSSNYNTFYFVTATRAITYDSNAIYYEMHDIDDYDIDYINNYFITNIYTTSTISGNHPFDYLFQRYVNASNKTTVKQYLGSIVAGTSKDEFVGYCAGNQQAYAKLLLELMILNRIDPSQFIVTYPHSIGNSSDSSAVSVNECTYYSDLYVDNTYAEYEDDYSYYLFEYAFTFTQMNFNVSDYDTVLLYVGPVNTQGTLRYSTDGTNYTTETIEEIMSIEIDTSSSSTLYLQSTSSDVYFYAIYYITATQATISDNSSNNYVLLDEATNGRTTPGNIIYTLPSSSDIETRIRTILSNNGITPATLTYDVNMNFVAYNNNDNGWLRYFRLVIDNDRSTSTNNDITILGTSTATVANRNTFSVSTTDSSYLGKAVGLMVSQTQNGTYNYDATTSNGQPKQYRWRLYKIEITINYSYTYLGTIYNRRAILTNDDIHSILNDSIGYSKEDSLATVLQNSQDYSTKYNNLLDDATYNLIPIDYSQSMYRSTLVSDTYYVNSGSTYTQTSGVYDSTKNYYTNNGGTYTAATIDANTYYNTVQSGKYYVSYEQASGAYNSNAVYYTRNGNVYTRATVTSSDYYPASYNQSTYYVRTGGAGTELDPYTYALATTYDSNTQYYTYDNEVYTAAAPSEAVFYQDYVSNTYYVNGGTNYQLATRTYDSNLTYYTESNGTYTAASISETQYYNSTTSNTYYSNFRLASGEYISTANTYYTRSGAGTSADPYIYTVASPSESAYYGTTTSNKYFTNTSGTYATGDYDASNTYYIYENSEYVEHGKASRNIIDLLELSSTHTEGITPEYCVPDFLKLFITSSNEAFLTFVNHAVVASENEDEDLAIIIQELLENIGYISLGDAVNTPSITLSEETTNMLATAYLVSDYRYILTNQTNVYDSKLNVYVMAGTPNSCKYFLSNGTYLIPFFENFCAEIGYNLSTTGYGIYALASNQGKLNGQFIPDNLELDIMDPYYEVSASVGYVLVDGSSSDASWRGGTTSDEDDDSDTTSVNYAFYDEMKQLNASISTVVFDLTITDGTDTYYGDIDLKNHTITYYVEELDTPYTVTNIDLAYKAKALKGAQNSWNDNIQEFVAGSQFGDGTTDYNVSAYQFTVFAENIKVHDVYSIIFKKITTTLTMVYDNSCLNAGDTSVLKTVTSSTTDSTVILNITSSNEKLRKGLNLEPYLSFVKMDGSAETDTVYRMNSDFITLSVLSIDHRIKADGSAVATMSVSYKIPAGTYRIYLSICGNSTYVTYVKEASSECEIHATFGGQAGDIFASSITANSLIDFGRLYNNIELTDYLEEYEGLYGEFYLDSFTYSANATLTVSADYDTIDVTLDDNVLYTKYVYTITYVITSEDESVTKTYTHILTEKDPYSDGDKYASVTKDGADVNPYSSGTTLYNQDATITNDNVVSLKYDSTTDTRARVQFDRADANGHLNEPRYIITYTTDNIYTISPYVRFTTTDVTTDTEIVGSASLKTGYHQMKAELSSSTETGYYEFMYTYTNTGKWYTLDENNKITTDSETGEIVYIDYTSTYNFPILQVNKLFSLDATLHSISFIDSLKVLGSASTGMRIHGMRPTDEHLDTASQEICYIDQLDDSSNWDIAVNSDGTINYAQKGEQYDYGISSYYDYYIVGSVANAQLSNYAPTFKIEDNALIFQYVTERIKTNYGLGKQGSYTDADILEDHSTKTYLYVPFTYEGTDSNNNVVTLNKTFLVELASNGKTLTNIYDAKTYESKGVALNRTINQCATTTGITVTIDGTTYTLSRAEFGKPTNNSSLYMDYIGNPVEDHFWYVSYVVYSENYIKSANNTYVKYYHIALIDRSNNVYFEIDVIVPVDFDITKFESLYLLINGFYLADKTTMTFSELSVGAYVHDPLDYTLGSVAKKRYTLRYSIQMLPSAYYYFNIDLPVGYQAEATVTNKTNAIDIGDYLGGNPDNAEHTLTYDGAYLPPSSIVAQVVKLTINVTEGAASETNVWGIQSSDVYTRRAVLDDDNVVGNAHTS
ncbi:MAG: hypothetical protein IJM36_02670 [Acholeplasmatales bacterium]|nr:hypothetical protein [Acholeplasmatales bacterium]